jgi:tripartite-type tricarboxylate transporter receptor subunit TctC
MFVRREKAVSLFSHRFYLFVAAAGAIVAVSCVASAQTDLTRPLRIIVPCAAGTPTDFVARLLAKEMLERSGQRVVVENFAAGAESIGIDTITKLLADSDSMLFNWGQCND